jgi:hypothetical protein
MRERIRKTVRLKERDIYKGEKYHPGMDVILMKVCLVLGVLRPVVGHINAFCEGCQTARAQYTELSFFLVFIRLGELLSIAICIRCGCLGLSRKSCSYYESQSKLC